MNVQLIGGPFDGQLVEWIGGDIIEMWNRRSTLDFSVPTVEPIRRDVSIYRQSVKTPQIFVFQP